jgi:glutamate synthase (NADPH/NADH) small chain
MNKNPNKTKMPQQDPVLRRSNFDEVTLGYTEEMAAKEASRCLGCKDAPCIAGCPVGINIPGFIKYIAQGDFKSAYEEIRKTNSLPAVCGRVCPQESQCEIRCVRGKNGEPVAIGALERFAADWFRENSHKIKRKITKSGKKVAIIGSGPAGLSCAGDLAMMGYDVTIFESFHVPGGVLVYGIPEFRLPKSIVAFEIEKLKDIGVTVETNMVIGKIMTVEDLFDEGYLAVFIGSGAGLPRFMNIKGESLNGVYSANEYLTRINLMKAYRDDYATPVQYGKNVLVVGGGNVAMDAARSAIRMGAEKVRVIYRRSRDEMPARAEEIEHAIEEGVEFIFLAAPVELLENEKGWVSKAMCIKMELGEPDKSGRRSPSAIEGSEFMIDIDCVVMALGTSPNPIINVSTPGLSTNRKGCIITEEMTGATTREGVFAGGDAVTGAATVILAMEAGKKSAAAIDKYIKERK